MFEKTFKALSAPVRRDILNLLKKGRMSAGDIAAQVCRLNKRRKR